MKEKIKNLIFLQECDNNIRSADIKRQRVPLKIQTMEKEFTERISAYNIKFEKLEKLKKERRSLEQTVQDLESKLQSSRIKLNNIKSNKEYAAVLKEIEVLEKTKNREEDQILSMMEEIESLDRECRMIMKEQEKEKERLENDKNEIKKELNELNAKIEVFEKQRQEYCKAVDRELLGKYNMLKDRRAGVAIGAVIEGVCQSCHMNIPPQSFNELRKCRELMTCPHCNRLVYWGEDEYFVNLHNTQSSQ